MDAAGSKALDALEALAPEWEQLWLSDPRATPFQSPAWLIPWTRHLWGGGQLLLFAEHTTRQLTGFLPLFRWGQTPATTVSFLGAGVGDYGDQLGTFRNLTLPPDTVLEEVRPSSPLYLPGSEPCSTLPLVILPAQLDPKLKQDLHRAMNRLGKLNHCFTLTTNPQPFLDLHAKRWNHTPDPPLEAFQREVCERFAQRGLLRLHLLTIEDAPAAALFAFLTHGTLYCYLSAFNPALHKLSPGALLLRHAIAHAEAEGCTAVDFLRGREPYKYLWGAQDRLTYRVRPGTNTSKSTEPPGS